MIAAFPFFDRESEAPMCEWEIYFKLADDTEVRVCIPLLINLDPWPIDPPHPPEDWLNVALEDPMPLAVNLSVLASVDRAAKVATPELRERLQGFVRAAAEDIAAAAPLPLELRVGQKV